MRRGHHVVEERDDVAAGSAEHLNGVNKVSALSFIVYSHRLDFARGHLVGDLPLDCFHCDKGMVTIALKLASVLVPFNGPCQSVLPLKRKRRTGRSEYQGD